MTGSTRSASSSSAARANPVSRRLLWLVPSAIACVAIAAWAFDVRAGLQGALHGVERLGVWGPLGFVALYVLATVLFLPGVILTLGAGAVFGLAIAIPTVSVAATLGAAAAFLVGRYLAREAVARKLEAYPFFRAVDAAVAREGWKIVGLMRLSPVFPFNLLNYAFGLTRVSFRDYVLASWVGMLPGTIAYVWLGALAGDLAMLDQPQAARPAAHWAVSILGFVATILVVAYVTRIARRALDERIAS